jgi:hypothetical protein
MNPQSAVFVARTVSALGQLKRELQGDYERAYPALREIIHLVLDEEEKNAWKLTPFPHLIFPDLVEAHVATLNLAPAETRHHALMPNGRGVESTILQPAFA